MSFCLSAAAEPIWWRMPSPSQLLQAYPEAARDVPGGIARIKCLPNRAGELTECSVVDETPAGVGFGEAALALAAGFRLTKQAAKAHEAGINLPIRFVRPEPAPPWRDAAFQPPKRYRELGVAGPYYPERAMRFEVGGEAVLDCRVEADSRLRDCKLVDVRPVDFGFEEAALRMIIDGWMRAGPVPTAVSPPADDIWRFKVSFSDTAGRFRK